MAHIVIVKEHSSVHVLWLIIEPNIIPMSRHHFIDRDLLMSEIFREGHWEMAGLQKSHLTLEILVLACVIVFISVTNSNSGGIDNCKWMHASSTKCIGDCFCNHFL